MLTDPDAVTTKNHWFAGYRMLKEVIQDVDTRNRAFIDFVNASHGNLASIWRSISNELQTGNVSNLKAAEAALKDLKYFKGASPAFIINVMKDAWETIKSEGGSTTEADMICRLNEIFSNHTH